MAEKVQRTEIPLSNDKAQELFTLSQWQLIRRKFGKHKVAVVSFYVLIALYTLVVFAPFVSPYAIDERSDNSYQPPQPLHFLHQNSFRLRPFVYEMEGRRDPETLRQVYEEDKSKPLPLRFFVRSWEYRLLGVIPTDVHLFGVEEGSAFLFGTDQLGRDMFSRILHGGQVSMSIGLMGIAISFVIGCALGGVSGYFGGAADMIIQRVIEFLISIPTLPLWMALSAAVPPDWPTLRVYFGITIILATIGWTGLARVVRGKLLEMRAEDYVMAAQLSGATEWRTIWRHMLPGMTSYLIVRLTLAIPGMILGETSLSFLGLGLRPPVVSWGVLLQAAQKLETLYLHKWMLLPAVFVVITVLAFNGLGDGLRDAADPYKR
jgi:peptide/nickel transport system permease protein